MKRINYTILAILLIIAFCCIQQSHAQLFEDAPSELSPPPDESNSPFLPEDIPANFTVALVGDMGITAEAKKVFELMKAEADMAIILGDLGYDYPLYEYDTATYRAKKWIKWKNEIVYNEKNEIDFPVFLTIGNHDTAKWNSYYLPDYKDFLDKFEKQIDKNICDGEPGVDAVCQYNGFFWVESGVGTTSQDQWDGHIDYIKSQLEQSDAIWKLCAWHTNATKYQLHSNKVKSKWDIPLKAYDVCGEHGAIKAEGHVHGYHRTFTLNNFEIESRTTPVFNNMTNKNSVEHTADSISQTPSGPASFVIVSGLGGRHNRGVQVRCKDPKEPCYQTWASVLDKSSGVKAGVFFITFNPYDMGQRVAYFYFKDIEGNIKDFGWITSANESHVVHYGKSNKTPFVINTGTATAPGCTQNFGNYSAMVGLPNQLREWDYQQLICSQDALLGAQSTVLRWPVLPKRTYLNDQNYSCDAQQGYMTSLKCHDKFCLESTIGCVSASVKGKKITDVKWTPKTIFGKGEVNCQNFGKDFVALNADFTGTAEVRLKCGKLENL